ncbi:MAG: hypothetical protein ABI375_11910 [Rudaea sp.]
MRPSQSACETIAITTAPPTAATRKGSVYKYAGLIVFAGLALLCAGAAQATTWKVVGISDDDAPGQECGNVNLCLTLRDAIFSATDGDTIEFDLSGFTLPTTISLANATPLTIAKGLTIHGPGYDKLTLSGVSASRVIYLPTTAPVGTSPVVIDHMTISGGVALGNNGADATTAGASGGNGQFGQGGCIYVGGPYTLHLDFDLITGCLASGGAGGNGAAGANGAAGTNAPNNGTSATGGDGVPGGNGGNGGLGGNAYGGAVYVDGALIVDSSTFRGNFASGGAGGDAGIGGSGGAGGAGGDSPCVPPQPNYPCLYIGTGGAGGKGGNGGNGGFGAAQGSGYGGAIFAHAPVTMINTTLTDNIASAGISFFGPLPTGGDGGVFGNGGNGGTGGFGATIGPNGANGISGSGGYGGSGGDGSGGAFYSINTNTDPALGSLLEQTSIGFNTAVGGFGGAGKNGSGAGNNGQGYGAGVTNQAGGTLTAWNSIVANNVAHDPIINTSGTNSVPSNCHVESPLMLSNDNLDDDAVGTPGTEACGFDLHGNPNFAPQKNSADAYPWGGNGMPVLMPLAPSPAIGGAAVHGSFDQGGCALNVDARGVSRPYLLPNPFSENAACDLGAVQNDIIFRDGFGN